MTLVLNKSELARIYNFTCNLNSPNVTRVFNGIFGSKPVDHVKLVYRPDDVTEIQLEEDIANEFLDILVKNGYALGRINNYSGLGLISHIKVLLNNAKGDFEKLANKF